MMTVEERLEQLLSLAKKNPELRAALLASKKEHNPVSAFCAVAMSAGVMIGAVELVSAGEESYAAMKRSTNGGGENSPMLTGEDDLYELFLVDLEHLG